MTKKENTKENAKQTRKALSPEDIARLIKEWDDKSTQEWADEFGVAYQIIAKTANLIRKKKQVIVPKENAGR